MCARMDDPGPEHVHDRLIPPEITNDGFSRAIVQVAATPGVREILEIGSSAGAGSTEAWVVGALRNPTRPRLHCIEVSRVRHAALVERWKDHPFVHAHNLSSVPLERFRTPEDVKEFYRGKRSRLRRTPLPVVLEWLQADLAYVRENGLSMNGIAQIQAMHDLDGFDAVLIDGSEFTGVAELDAVYGARFILLDDTRTFKNWENARRLGADPAYELVVKSRWTRNGFAVFERADGVTRGSFGRTLH